MGWQIDAYKRSHFSFFLIFYIFLIFGTLCTQIGCDGNFCVFIMTHNLGNATVIIKMITPFFFSKLMFGWEESERRKCKKMKKLERING